MSGSRTPRSGASKNQGKRKERYPIHRLIPKRTELLLTALLAPCLAAGCASIPVTKIPPPKKAVRIDDPSRLAGKEWFWGVYIMGKRVGYSYLSIERAPSMKDALKITSRLKLDNIIKCEEYQVDYTRLDLTLLKSEYGRKSNGDTIRVITVGRPGRLEIQTTTMETSTWKKKELDHSVYPSSVINLLPIVRGLWVDNSYRYPVYQPATGSILTVRQRVKSYGRLEEDGRTAFRLTTKLKGQKTQSWIDARGNMLKEKGNIGIFSMSLVLENP